MELTVDIPPVELLSFFQTLAGNFFVASPGAAVSLDILAIRDNLKAAGAQKQPAGGAQLQEVCVVAFAVVSGTELRRALMLASRAARSTATSIARNWLPRVGQREIAPLGEALDERESKLFPESSERVPIGFRRPQHGEATVEWSARRATRILSGWSSVDLASVLQMSGTELVETLVRTRFLNGPSKCAYCHTEAAAMPDVRGLPTLRRQGTHSAHHPPIRGLALVFRLSFFAMCTGVPCRTAEQWYVFFAHTSKYENDSTKTASCLAPTVWSVVSVRCKQMLRACVNNTNGTGTETSSSRGMPLPLALAQKKSLKLVLRAGSDGKPGTPLPKTDTSVYTQS